MALASSWADLVEETFFFGVMPKLYKHAVSHACES